MSSLPLILVNAESVQGVSPGYNTTAGIGLTANLSSGVVDCLGTIISYSGGTISLMDNQTNNIYMNASSNCAPSVKTTAFTASDIPLSVVVTDIGSISSITDVRTFLSTTTAAPGTIGLCVDGGGAVPATGAKGFIQVPYACTITGWTMIADQAGEAQITISMGTYAAFPTVSSIVASLPPVLGALSPPSTQQKNTSTTLTGWTTAIATGDILSFNLDSITTCQRITLEIQVSRS